MVCKLWFVEFLLRTYDRVKFNSGQRSVCFYSEIMFDARVKTIFEIKKKENKKLEFHLRLGISLNHKFRTRTYRYKVYYFGLVIQISNCVNNKRAPDWAPFRLKRN